MFRGARLSASGQNAGVMEVLLERNLPHAPPASRGSRYRPDIQGLRALAVLAVIANHLAGWPKGSFVGVDVFFVISGYLITGILVREFETRQTISLLGFYARRIKRILPAGLFVIGVTRVRHARAGRHRPLPLHRSRRDRGRRVSRQLAFRPGRGQLLQPVAAAIAAPALLVPVGGGAVLLRVALGATGPAAHRPPPALVAPRAHAPGRRCRDRRHLRRLAGVGIRADRRQPDDGLLLHVGPRLGARPGGADRHRRRAHRAPQSAPASDRRMDRPSRPAPVTPHRPLVPWVSRAVGAAPHPLRRGGDRHGRRPPGAVAAAADQPGLPVRGRPLLQPLPVALPGRRAHRHPRPPLLGHLLGGGSGAHLRLVGRLISPAGEPGAARHLVCPSSRTPPGPRPRLAPVRRGVRRHGAAGRRRPGPRALDQSEPPRPPRTRPGWPHAGRPARLPGCGGP